jgi:hypothetical protein
MKSGSSETSAQALDHFRAAVQAEPSHRRGNEMLFLTYRVILVILSCVSSIGLAGAPLSDGRVMS